MCGICGIANSDNALMPYADLDRMNATLLHRGPDSQGSYIKPGIAMAMRRLSIIDVAGSSQPLFNEDKSLVLVFNGELYNYASLQSKLTSNGHTLRTKGDAECVVHLYEEHGTNCVQHLRGQFAFALWDEKDRSLFLARDRFGEKPLYYTLQNGSLYFGSELSAIYAALPSRPPISLQAIDLYLALQYIPEPMTAYFGIHKLPAGHTLHWKGGILTIEKYWELNYEPKLQASEEELAEELRDRMRASVRQCLVGEVPLGAHLSGGIDSSIIVALMAESGHGQIKTFSAGFQEESFSELKFARAVADLYGTEHHEFILEYGDIPATVSEVLRHVGEPFADSSTLPLFHLCRLTRQHVTVALNGDGGDEMFGGYLRHRLDPWADAYLRAPSIARSLLVSALHPLRDNADKPIGGSIVNGLKRLEQLSQVDRRASILRWSSYFSQHQRKDLWSDEAREQLDLCSPERLLVDLYDKAPAKTSLDRTLYTDIKTYLPGALLVKSDRMTMAHSLEGRSPFLDHELAEWAARLPTNMKTRGRTGKYLLRKAFAPNLPDQVMNRGKRGFGVPVGAWIRKPLAGWSRDLLLPGGGPMHDWFQRTAIEKLLADHQSGRADHGRRLWALTCLALWLESAPK